MLRARDRVELLWTVERYEQDVWAREGYQGVWNIGWWCCELESHDGCLKKEVRILANTLHTQETK